MSVKIFKLALTLFLVNLIGVEVASAQSWNWGKWDDGSGVGADHGRSVGTSADGYVVNPYTNLSGHMEIRLRNADSGNVIWTVNEAAVKAYARSIDFDEFNNIYVAGTFTNGSSHTFAGNGSSNSQSIIVDAESGSVSFLAKYDIDGNLKWVERIKTMLPVKVKVGNYQNIFVSMSGSTPGIPSSSVCVNHTESSNICTTLPAPGSVIAVYDGAGEVHGILPATGVKITDHDVIYANAASSPNRWAVWLTGECANQYGFGNNLLSSNGGNKFCYTRADFDISTGSTVYSRWGFGGGRYRFLKANITGDSRPGNVSIGDKDNVFFSTSFEEKFELYDIENSVNHDADPSVKNDANNNPVTYHAVVKSNGLTDVEFVRFHGNHPLAAALGSQSPIPSDIVAIGDTAYVGSVQRGGYPLSLSDNYTYLLNDDPLPMPLKGRSPIVKIDGVGQMSLETQAQQVKIGSVEKLVESNPAGENLCSIVLGAQTIGVTNLNNGETYHSFPPISLTYEARKSVLGRYDLSEKCNLPHDWTPIVDLNFEECGNTETIALPSPWGQLDVRIFDSSDLVVFNTDGTENESGYHPILWELDKGNWTSAGYNRVAEFGGWECATCSVPQGLIANNFLPAGYNGGNGFKPDTLYYFGLAIGPQWMSKGHYFYIDP